MKQISFENKVFIVSVVFVILLIFTIGMVNYTINLQKADIKNQVDEEIGKVDALYTKAMYCEIYVKDLISYKGTCNSEVFNNIGVASEELWRNQPCKLFYKGWSYDGICNDQIIQGFGEYVRADKQLEICNKYPSNQGCEFISR